MRLQPGCNRERARQLGRGAGDLSHFKTAPPPAPNDDKIFRPGLKILQVWLPKQPGSSGAVGDRGSPWQRGQEARASRLRRAGFENRYPGSPRGEKSDFPKPQSTRCFYTRQLPAVLGNARPSPPQLRGGRSAWGPAHACCSHRPGKRAAHVGPCLVAWANWASSCVLEHAGLRLSHAVAEGARHPPSPQFCSHGCSADAVASSAAVTAGLVPRPRQKCCPGPVAAAPGLCFALNPLSPAAFQRADSDFPGCLSAVPVCLGGLVTTRCRTPRSGRCWRWGGGGDRNQNKPPFKTVFPCKLVKETSWQGGGVGEDDLGCPSDT